MLSTTVASPCKTLCELQAADTTSKGIKSPAYQLVVPLMRSSPMVCTLVLFIKLASIIRFVGLLAPCPLLHTLISISPQPELKYSLQLCTVGLFLSHTVRESLVEPVKVPISWIWLQNNHSTFLPPSPLLKGEALLCHPSGLTFTSEGLPFNFINSKAWMTLDLKASYPHLAVVSIAPFRTWSWTMTSFRHCRQRLVRL